MTFTCFPEQTPFPLPPGVTTAPAAPELIDNGPQTPPNSVEIGFWIVALIGSPETFVDWQEALISVDTATTDWTLVTLSEEEQQDELDLCELVGLLDSLPTDEVFVPDLEDPDSPLLPPFQETFYSVATVRLAGSWFFIPGPTRVDGGALDAGITLQLDAGKGITTLVDVPVHLIMDERDAAVGRIRVKVDAA